MKRKRIIIVLFILLFLINILIVKTEAINYYNPPGTGSYSNESTLPNIYWIIGLYCIALINIIVGIYSLKKKQIKRIIFFIIIAVICVVTTYFIPIKQKRNVEYGCFYKSVQSEYFNIFKVKIYEKKE